MRDINNFLILHSAKNQVKYVVFEEALLSLFACPSCHLSTPTITKHECGIFIRVKQACEHCEAVNIWDSQHWLCINLYKNVLRTSTKVSPSCYLQNMDEEQQALISVLLFDNIPLVLRGDDRADNPGHCANLVLTQ